MEAWKRRGVEMVYVSAGAGEVSGANIGYWIWRSVCSLAELSMLTTAYTPHNITTPCVPHD